MPRIITRNAANLPRVPNSIGHRSLSSWAGIRIHHTGGSFSSWRAVHDWQTKGRDPGDRLAYIGYSFGISGGNVYELRGWDRHPAHDFINTHLGVVFGGNFENRLPAPADLNALIWFVELAASHTGRRLPISTHREVGQTTCPGTRLHSWIKQILPGQLEDDDMDLNDVFERPAGAGTTTVAAALGWTLKHAGDNKGYLQRLIAGQAAIRAWQAQQDGATEAEVRAVVRAELAGLSDSLALAVNEALRDVELDLDDATMATLTQANVAAIRATFGSLDEEEPA